MDRRGRVAVAWSFTAAAGRFEPAHLGRRRLPGGGNLIGVGRLIVGLLASVEVVCNGSGGSAKAQQSQCAEEQFSFHRFPFRPRAGRPGQCWCFARPSRRAKRFTWIVRNVTRSHGRVAWTARQASPRCDRVWIIHQVYREGTDLKSKV